MRFPAMHLDMVRPGLILYGMVPPGCPDAYTELEPAMTLKSNLVLVKKFRPTPRSVMVDYLQLDAKV